MPVSKNVVIRWKSKGSFITKRRGSRRYPGDEDICSRGKAKSLQVVGLVDILGTESEVMEERTIGSGSVIDILGIESGREEEDESDYISNR